MEEMLQSLLRTPKMLLQSPAKVIASVNGIPLTGPHSQVFWVFSGLVGCFFVLGLGLGFGLFWVFFYYFLRGRCFGFFVFFFVCLVGFVLFFVSILLLVAFLSHIIIFKF